MELKFILEAILFSAQKPLSAKELRDLLTSAAELPDEPETRPFKKVKEEALTTALEELARDHEAAQRSYRLACVAGAWQFVSQPEFAPWLRALLGSRNRPSRLSQPALETLAIIAYRQPLTRAEMEQIRGVSVDGVIQTLIERNLVVQTGHADVPGRPGTYGTTPEFLQYFGLRALDDLPAADELRKIVVKKPGQLLTADAGLATVPPEQLSLAEVTGQTAEPPHVDPTAPSEPPAPAGTASRPGESPAA